MVYISKRLTFIELSESLREYEQKYGYSTIEFYSRFQDGELGDDDDLMMWSGLVHLARTNDICFLPKALIKLTTRLSPIIP
jgi:hypothetical protein